MLGLEGSLRRRTDEGSVPLRWRTGGKDEEKEKDNGPGESPSFSHGETIEYIRVIVSNSN